MIIKRLYSSQEVVEGLHLVWDVFIRENANSCTQQGIEEFARFIKMDRILAVAEPCGGMDIFPFCLSARICGEKGLRRLLLVKCADTVRCSLL